jgi:hypothetical protein
MSKNYNPNAQASSGLIEGSGSFALGSLLKNYGNYIGGIVNIAWFVCAYYLFIHIRKEKVINKYYYLGPVLLVLLPIIDTLYYFKATKTPETKKTVNSIYANIAFIPIYIAILIFAVMVGTNGRF